MSTLDKLPMLSMAVNDVEKIKRFYTEMLDFTLTGDQGYGGQRWVTLSPPGGGITLTVTNVHENMKPGTLKLYLSAPDIQAAYDDLTTKGLLPDHPVTDDQWSRWFDFHDPEGNYWVVTQS